MKIIIIIVFLLAFPGCDWFKDKREKGVLSEITAPSSISDAVPDKVEPEIEPLDPLIFLPNPTPDELIAIAIEASPEDFKRYLEGLTVKWTLTVFDKQSRIYRLKAAGSEVVISISRSRFAQDGSVNFPVTLIIGDTFNVVARVYKVSTEYNTIGLKLISYTQE